MEKFPKYATEEIDEKMRKEAQEGAALIRETELYEKTAEEEKEKKAEEEILDAEFEDIKEADIEKEVEKMPKEEKEKMTIGLANLGYYVEERKNTFFHKLFKKTGGKFDKKKTMGRFLGSLSENYERDAKKAEKKMERTSKTGKGKLASGMSLGGNILKYGRTVMDITGYAVASPFRYVMAGSMMFSRGSEAAKDARLKNEKVLEKTRVEDIDKAAEEAWKIYEQAKGDKEEISKEELDKAYRQNIPEDVLKRLLTEPEPGTASTLIQKMMAKQVEYSTKRIAKKIEKIENDEKLSKKEKKARKEQIINKYSEKLKDYDGMVSQFGTVDGLAMGAKYGQTAGKAVVYAMMAETIAKAVETASDIFSEAPAPIPEAPEKAPIMGRIIQGPDEGGLETELAEEIKPVPEGEVLTPAQKADYIETAKKGDSIWKISERQLEEHYGEKFTGLDEAEKTYMIDAIKDKVVADPGKFGLESADKIDIGQEIDLQPAFEDRADIDKAFEKAGSLTDTQKENILHPIENIEVEPQTTGEEVWKAMEESSERIKQVNIIEKSYAFEELKFTPEEYTAIKDVKVGKLLERLPSEKEAWTLWHSDESVDLPHDGIYGAGEFKKHIKLAEFIRSKSEEVFDKTTDIKDLTVSKLLRTIADLEVSPPA